MKNTDDQTGKGILTCLQRHNRSKTLTSKGQLPGFLRESFSIRAGEPVLIQNYDATEDAVVFAYDPEQTPAPEMALRNGIVKGEKLLFMDGELVVHFSDAGALKIADINIVETGLQD
ncbi:MAG: hypothetical protein ACU0CA_04220 [Paracoccaceae bacterium]